MRSCAFRCLAIGQSAALVVAAAVAAARIEDLDFDLVGPAACLGLLLAAGALTAFRTRRASVAWVATAIVSAALLAGAAVVVDAAAPTSLLWLWIGMAAAGAAVSVYAVAVAWHQQDAGSSSAPAREVVPALSDLNDETVQLGLENVRWVLADEQARGQTIQARASSLAGFAGVILSLLIGAAVALTQADVARSQPDDATRVLLAAGTSVLVAAIAALLLGVMTTRQIQVTAASEVERYTRRGFATADPTAERGRITATLAISLAKERRRNSGRAQWLNCGAAAIFIALVLVAAAALTMLL